MKASCNSDRHAPRPRHVFHPVGQQVFRFTKVSPAAIKRCTKIAASPDHRGFLGIQKTETGGHIVVIVVDKRAVQVSSEHVWRTMTAKWVNSKLVYFERSFNEHFSHVCLYDCHREQVVVEEFMTDGTMVQRTELAALKPQDKPEQAGKYVPCNSKHREPDHGHQPIVGDPEACLHKP